MSHTMYYGIIKLIYKKKGDKAILQNWRPLSMLNVDYKILAKVLLFRMKPYMDSIIHPNQNCSVAGRDIRDGVLTIINAIEYAKTEKLDNIILAVDHKAAFDMIEWNFLFDVLHKMNFSPQFITWMKIIYKNGFVHSSVCINGYISSALDLTRGIRQGCPLSALLYVITNEVICETIRQDLNVKGIAHNINELKITAYADDTNFLLASVESVDRIMKHYKDYTGASGARLNTEKTQLLLLGTSNISAVPQHLTKFIVSKIKIYGFTFDKNGLAIEDCMTSINDKLQKLLAVVPHHEFSLESKIHYVNTYYLSKLWYLATFITPGQEITQLAERAIDHFLWYPAVQHKVKKKVLKNLKDNGGITYPDIALRTLAMRLMLLFRRDTVSDNKDWKNSFDELLRKCNSYNEQMRKHLQMPQLYLDILQIVKKTNYRITNEGNVALMGKLFPISSVNTKLIYSLLVNKNFLPAVEKTKNEWKIILGNNDIKFENYYNCNFLKLTDSYTKDLHYLIVNNALYTRNRLAKFTPVSPNCYYCSNQNVNELETVLHAISCCSRMQQFWQQVEALCRTVNPQINLHNENKIFGVLLDARIRQTIVLNVLIQLAQKAVWTTRALNEKKSYNLNIWLTYKKWSSCSYIR